VQYDTGFSPAADVLKGFQPVSETRTDLIPLRSNIAGAEFKLTTDIQYGQRTLSRRSILPVIIPQFDRQTSSARTGLLPYGENICRQVKALFS
jgi:hypothetical protein